MSRVAYVLGFLLILIGGASIAIGSPDVRFEQGWTEVIAGSVAASAGCVVLVMGMLLSRLTALLASVRSLSMPLADQPARQPVDVVPLYRARAAAVADAPAEPALNGPDVTVAGPVAEEQDAVAEHQRPVHPQPEFNRPSVVEDVPPQPVAFDIDEMQAAGPPGTPMLPPNESRPALTPARRRQNFLASFLSRRAAQREEELSRLFTPSTAGFEPDSHEAEASHDNAENQPYEQPHELDGFNLPPPHEVEHLRPTYDEVAPDDHHAAPAVDERVEVNEPEEAVEPKPPSTPADHPLRPSVVGRYTAGSASYVMYSNGMIEVETEAGIHHFNSMQELKAFIEGQESAQV